MVPQYPTPDLVARWQPVIESLERRLDLTIRFATAASIDVFADCLRSGAYDLAYANPQSYVEANQSAGYKAAARLVGGPLQGNVVVREGGDHQTLEDLDGGGFAIPSESAFAAAMLTQAALRDAGVQVEVRALGSHSSVYRAVAAGLIEAGGGVQRTLAAESEEVRVRLRVIHRTARHPSHPIAAHLRLDEDMVDELRAALVSMERDDGAALEAAGLRGFVPATDADYAPVRALRLRSPRPAEAAGKEPACLFD